MEVLNPIYTAPSMTILKKLQKLQFWIFILHCLMKRNGVGRMSSFLNRDISEWGSWYEPKND